MNRLLDALTPRRLFWALLGVPMLLAIVYYAVLAQDRYVSNSVMTIRRANQDGVSPNGLALLIAGSGGASHEDALYLRDYIRSLGLMNRLDGQLKLRTHYENAHGDPFYRLWPQSSQEWMLDYWRSRVDVTLDEQSNLLQLRVEGFDPAFAQRINQALLAESEAFVNAISHRIAREQLGFAQGELEQASEKLNAARQRLITFQTEKQVLDPMASAQATATLTSEMRAQLAKLEAELSSKRSFLNEDAPDVVSLKGQVAAVRLQITRETVGATRADSGAINRLAVEYQEIKSRVGFAEDAYKTALSAVESTRLEAGRKVKSLVVIEPPTLAQRAEYPRRFYNFLTVFVFGLLIYALTRLALATINEHRD